MGVVSGKYFGEPTTPFRNEVFESYPGVEIYLVVRNILTGYLFLAVWVKRDSNAPPVYEVILCPSGFPRHYSSKVVDVYSGWRAKNPFYLGLRHAVRNPVEVFLSDAVILAVRPQSHFDCN